LLAARAGQYRTADTNIGVAHHLIRQELRRLYDDARAWLEYECYPPDEIAARLHYRIVSVHPFPNGNGRHARMLADIVMVRHFKSDPLSWGGGSLQNADVNRAAYIEAPVAADRHDFTPLLQFARSRGA
jgi:Fic-DOC domain mobile mystery protein B